MWSLMFWKRCKLTAVFFEYMKWVFKNGVVKCWKLQKGPIWQNPWTYVIQTVIFSNKKLWYLEQVNKEENKSARLHTWIFTGIAKILSINNNLWKKLIKKKRSLKKISINYWGMAFPFLIWGKTGEFKKKEDACTTLKKQSINFILI